MWRSSTTDRRCRRVRPEVVTVSYNEAARSWTAASSVDAVPMPPEILAWMAPFVAEHYKPEPKRKVRRNDPFADDGDERAAAKSRSTDAATR